MVSCVRETRPLGLRQLAEPPRPRASSKDAKSSCNGRRDTSRQTRDENKGGEQPGTYTSTRDTTTSHTLNTPPSARGGRSSKQEAPAVAGRQTPPGSPAGRRSGVPAAAAPPPPASPAGASPPRAPSP